MFASNETVSQWKKSLRKYVLDLIRLHIFFNFVTGLLNAVESVSVVRGYSLFVFVFCFLVKFYKPE